MDNSSFKLEVGIQNLTLWNQMLANELLPYTLVLILYILIGTTGNSAVIYVYVRRFRGQIEDRFFIPYLAAIDLISCIICASFGISINLLPVNFTNDGLCKALWFLAMVTTGCSAFSLMVIAVQRYQKICKPFGKQMTSRTKKIAISLVIGGSIILSLPCFLFYGSAPLYSDEWNVTGYRCTSILGKWGKIPPLIFKGIILLSVLGDLIVLSVLYTLIGRVIFKQMHFRKKRGGPAIAESSDTVDASAMSKTGKGIIATDDASGSTLVSVISLARVKAVPGTVENSFTSDSSDCEPSVDKTLPNICVSKTSTQLSPTNLNCSRVTENQSKESKKKSTKNTKLHQMPGFRLSLMFMVITLVFIICFLPKLGMLVYESRNADFWLKLNPSEMGGFRFLYTMYIINNIVNPFIYGFFDKKFQKEFKGLFCSCCSKN